MPKVEVVAALREIDDRLAQEGSGPEWCAEIRKLIARIDGGGEAPPPADWRQACDNVLSPYIRGMSVRRYNGMLDELDTAIQAEFMKIGGGDLADGSHVDGIGKVASEPPPEPPRTTHGDRFEDYPAAAQPSTEHVTQGGDKGPERDLVAELGRHCVMEPNDTCRRAFPDKSSVCGPVKWCAVCRAADELAVLREERDEVQRSLNDRIEWLEEALDARLGEMAELRTENERLAKLNKMGYCVYCGVDVDDADAMRLHVNVCEKHPIRKAESRVAELREALEEIRTFLTTEWVESGNHAVYPDRRPLLAWTNKAEVLLAVLDKEVGE